MIRNYCFSFLGSAVFLRGTLNNAVTHNGWRIRSDEIQHHFTYTCPRERRLPTQWQCSGSSPPHSIAFVSSRRLLSHFRLAPLIITKWLQQFPSHQSNSQCPKRACVSSYKWQNLSQKLLQTSPGVSLAKILSHTQNNHWEGEKLTKNALHQSYPASWS